MKRYISLITIGILLSALAGYAVGQQQKAKDTAAINVLAWFTLNGNKFDYTASKRLTLVNLRFNDINVPCIIADTRGGGLLTYDLAGNASVSCGWTPETIQALAASTPLPEAKAK